MTTGEFSGLWFGVRSFASNGPEGEVYTFRKENAEWSNFDGTVKILRQGVEATYKIIELQKKGFRAAVYAPNPNPKLFPPRIYVKYENLKT